MAVMLRMFAGYAQTLMKSMSDITKQPDKEATPKHYGKGSNADQTKRKRLKKMSGPTLADTLSNM